MSVEIPSFQGFYSTYGWQEESENPQELILTHIFLNIRMIRGGLITESNVSFESAQISDSEEGAFLEVAIKSHTEV